LLRPRRPGQQPQQQEPGQAMKKEELVHEQG
jgi:hypothetical protein